MHHASPSVGALAAALAKAQSELLNPEKSLVATISSGSPGPERTFRYAPLSTGLDIIRKTLGRHEIATIQTTAIDQGAGLIRLTTILAHGSGEWISSDWPVCSLSETAAPHRLGAALTYARRYALFALVGIAGEDDGDAPDLVSESAERQASPAGAATRGSPDSLPHPRAPQMRGRPAASKPVLAWDASAILREQLQAELAGVTSHEELTTWVARNFPIKNSLQAHDAHVLEQAFEEKGVLLGAELQEPAPAKAALDAPITESASLGRLDEAGPAALLIPKITRRRDKRHLRFVATLPCLVCGRRPSDAHHLRFTEPRALGRKVSDEFTVPICRVHHTELHARGDERAWWTEVQIDPVPVAHQLWSATR